MSEKMTEEKKRHRESYEAWSSQGGLVELEGKKLAEIVGMMKKPLGEGYGRLFAEQSGEKNIFGGKGGWKFPLINKIRGKVHAHRFQKGLESGDIEAFGLPDRALRAVTESGKPFNVGGQFNPKRWTRSRMDANMYLALGRPLRDLFITLGHEGAHMEPLLGKQIVHGAESMTQHDFTRELEGALGDYFDKTIAKAEKAFPAEDWGREETLGEEGVQLHSKLADVYMKRYDDTVYRHRVKGVSGTRKSRLKFPAKSKEM